MKKNIDKPELNLHQRAMLHAFMASIIISAIENTKGQKKVPRKIIRHTKQWLNASRDKILSGDWEQTITPMFRSSFVDCSFQDAFSEALNTILVHASDEELSRGGDFDPQEIKLGAMRIAKVYEYMTGKDYKTGKKIHKGVLDAD